MALSRPNLRSVVTSVLAIGVISSAASASAAPIVTSIEIDNDATSTAISNTKPNLSGTASPSFPSTISASKIYVGATTTPSIRA